MSNSTREGGFSKGEKGLSEELKGQVIDKILETGGDRISGDFPVKWTELGDKFGVSGKTAAVYSALDQITVNDTGGF